jgi:DNA-binding winged helix-turn-helix (wHTH) protein
MDCNKRSATLGATSQPLPDQPKMDNQQYLLSETLVFTPALYVVSQHVRSQPREIQLSQKESQLLDYLCQRPGQVVARTEIIAELWNDSESSDVGLNKNILMIRRKLESLGVAQAIRTVPRVGYTLELTVTVRPEESPPLPARSIDDSILPTTVSKWPADMVNHWHRYWLFALLGLVVALATVILGVSHDVTLDHLRKIKTSHGIIYRNDSSSEPIPKETQAALDDSVARHEGDDYRMLISDQLISVILYSHGHIRWEKAFFKGDNALPLQLRCVVAAMTSALLAPQPTSPSAGTVYNNIEFHAPCELGGHMLATLQTSHSGFGERIHSVVQTIALWNWEGKPVAVFDLLLDRVASFRSDGTHPEFTANMTLQSVKVEEIHREALDADPQLAFILSTYTSYDRLYIIVLEPERDLHVTTRFGGMLSTFKRAE